MNIDFLTVVVAVASLILLAVPAFILSKLKLLPEKTGEALSTIVLYGCQPVLVFMSFQGGEYRSEIGVNMLIVAGIATFVHLLIIGLSYLCIRGKCEEFKLRCLRAGCAFGNCAYMGLPFLQTLFGGSAVFGEVIIYTAVVLAVFNVLNWTLGVFMVTGNKKNVSLKKIILNPTIIGTLLGFILFITIKVPFVQLTKEGTTAHVIVSNLVRALNVIGDTVTPLAMFVIGIRLSRVSLKALFVNKWAYATCFIKLIVCAVVTILTVSFIPVSSVVKYTCFFLLSMPCATSTALFAVNFGGDGDTASVCVLLSTVLSIITIPLMFLLFSGVFGVTI